VSEFRSEWWLHIRRYLNVLIELVVNFAVVLFLLGTLSGFRYLIAIIFGDNPEPFLQQGLKIFTYVNDALSVGLLVLFTVKAASGIFKAALADINDTSVGRDTSADRSSSNE
jgi:hypothetical protein